VSNHFAGSVVNGKTLFVDGVSLHREEAGEEAFRRDACIQGSGEPRCIGGRLRPGL